MWGRLDAATFLVQVLRDQTDPGALDASIATRILVEIVHDEAPVLCEAVLEDATRGARNRYGSELFPDGRPKVAPPSWEDVVDVCRLELSLKTRTGALRLS